MDDADTAATVLDRLVALLDEDDVDATLRLAETLGGELYDCPGLVRTIEDAAIRTVYNKYRGQGEGHTHATRRTAEQLELPYERTRWRLGAMGVGRSTKGL